MTKIKITTPYIKLGQFLKLAHLIDSGGQEKIFLLTNTIYVNNEKENRRGRKLFNKDIVKVLDQEFEIYDN